MTIEWTAPITEWIKAAALVITLPTGFVAVIKLFKKDKDKDRKLNSLESLAVTQSEQLKELARQTSVFQYQAELMNESNDLLRKQVELQNSILLHNEVTEGQKLELQRAERLSKIKPHFVYKGGSSSPEKFTVQLLNKGETAKKLSLKRVDNEFAKIKDLDPSKEYDQNHTLEITGYADSSKTFFNSNQVPFEVLLFFEDVDGNRYSQKLSRTSIGTPVLLKD